MAKLKEGEKLTAKQELFVQEYLANGMKLIKAYCAAYPNASEKTANKESWKLMKKEPIKARIRELQHDRYEQLGINADSIAIALKQIADDPEATNTEKMKAYELLQKQLGLQTQKVEAEVKTTVIDINIEDEEE